MAGMRLEYVQLGPVNIEDLGDPASPWKVQLFYNDPLNLNKTLTLTCFVIRQPVKSINVSDVIGRACSFPPTVDEADYH
jgi:hypothetical protein